MECSALQNETEIDPWHSNRLHILRTNYTHHMKLIANKLIHSSIAKPSTARAVWRPTGHQYHSPRIPYFIPIRTNIDFACVGNLLIYSLNDGRINMHRRAAADAMRQVPLCKNQKTNSFFKCFPTWMHHRKMSNLGSSFDGFWLAVWVRDVHSKLRHSVYQYAVSMEWEQIYSNSSNYIIFNYSWKEKR